MLQDWQDAVRIAAQDKLNFAGLIVSILLFGALSIRQRRSPHPSPTLVDLMSKTARRWMTSVWLLFAAIFLLLWINDVWLDSVLGSLLTAVCVFGAYTFAAPTARERRALKDRPDEPDAGDVR